jgi:hypothetical protein
LGGVAHKTEGEAIPPKRRRVFFRLQGNIRGEEPRRNPQVRFLRRCQSPPTPIGPRFQEQAKGVEGSEESDRPTTRAQRRGDYSTSRRVTTNFSEYETCPMLEAVSHVPGSELLPEPIPNSADEVAGLKQGELPSYQQYTPAVRKPGTKSGGRRCVHYHTHYHTHYDSHARQQSIFAKAARAASSWWHKPHSYRRGHQGRPGKGSDDFHTVRIAARGTHRGYQANRAYLDNFSNAASQQRLHQDQRRRRGGSEPRSCARSLFRTSSRYNVEYYPWLHPYLRARKTVRASQVTHG